MKSKFLIFISVLTLFVFAGCSTEKENSAEKEKLQIVTTFYPMYDFSKKVAGNQGKVSVLMSGEVEPHDYEPSAKDIAKIQEADVFVYNSKEMETWVPSVLESVDTSKVKIIEASSGIELMDEEADSEEHEGHTHGADPHVWLDPVLAEKEAENIYQGLVEADSKNKTTYQKNYENFSGELHNLDKEFSEAFEGAQNNTFITQHAAFGYLASRYHLNQVAITGLTPDEEPSAKTLAELEDYVKNQGISVIYIEQSGSSKLADTIADATKAEVATLSTLETLSKKQQDEGADYLSVMRDNLKALRKSIK